MRVVNALNAVAPQFIKWAEAGNRREISRQFHRFGGIQNIIGAVDGTYVPIKAPKRNPTAYINRKCFHGITLQSVAIPSLMFTDCFTGYPSSVSDIRIFRNSDIYKRINNNIDVYFEEEQFLLGDKAYPLMNWIIPPYIDHGHLTQRQRNFNKVHAKSRQVIERSFALYFGRLRRMRYLDLNREDMYACTILAACVLHNICLIDPDDEVENYVREGLQFVQDMQQMDQNNENLENNIREMTRIGEVKRNQIAQQLVL